MLFSKQLGMDSRPGSRMAASGQRQSVFEALPVPMEDHVRKRVVSAPAWSTQITRKQAVVGKLLEDVSMNKVLNGVRGEHEDRMFVPDDSVKAGSQPKRAPDFSRTLGRETRLSGSRLAASPPSCIEFIAPEAVAKAERLTRPSSPQPIRLGKQVSRSKATNGFLLLDGSMRKLAIGSKGGDPGPYQDVTSVLTQSVTRQRLRQVDMSRSLGRDGAKSGSRMSAMGTNEGHWRPTRIPSLSLTRPRTSPGNIPWEKQTTRQQAVVGKLLLDQAMNKVLNGASRQGGAEHYDTDSSYFARRLVSTDMRKQTDRLTAVYGKLLNDQSYNALRSASAGREQPSSAARREAARRRTRGEDKQQASGMSASSKVEWAYAVPSGQYPSQGSGYLSVEKAMPVIRFDDQIGRVEHYRAGLRTGQAPPMGAAKRTDLLSSAADHLFR